MGLNDVQQTSLVLGLGLPSSTSITKINPQPLLIQNDVDDHLSKLYEPSLTLGLSGETHDQVHYHAVKSSTNKIVLNNSTTDHDEFNYNGRQDESPKSSSLSNVSVKRERDISSRVSDEDEEDGCNGKKKLRLTKAQSALLEESFKIHSTLNPREKQELARELKLRPRQVEVWFQNRRARTKLKQTEVDCEFLKKCCETLTDENRRLQKELQELKAMKLAQPLYMQMPAAAGLTMCPSCERVGGVTTENVANNYKSNFSTMGTTKSHFYNPAAFFTNPSACSL